MADGATFYSIHLGLGHQDFFSFLPASLFSILTSLFLFSSSVTLSYFFFAVWETSVHELLISYSHTECRLRFSDSATTSAQCVFGAKN